MIGRTPGLRQAGLRKAGSVDTGGGGGGGSGDMLAVNNLSDVADKPTARTNLGVGIGVHVQAFNAGLTALATAGSKAYVDDADAAEAATRSAADGARLVKASNLSDLANAGTARTNLGLVALAATGLVADITDAGAAGRSWLQAATATIQTALLNVATTVLAGLMSAADKVKVDGLPVLIDDVNVGPLSTWTSSSWAPGAYQEIKLRFIGRITNGWICVQVNGDGGLNYLDEAFIVTASDSAETSFFGVLPAARLGLTSLPGGTSSPATLDLTLYPLVNGNLRIGTASARSTTDAYAIASCAHRVTSWAWKNTAADVINIGLAQMSHGGLLNASETFTGRIQVWGIPA